METATEEKTLEKTTNRNFQKEHLETLKEIKKKYSTLCDRAKELVENGIFKYCCNPYKNEKGEITCNGSWIGNDNYVCPDVDMIHYLRYHEKHDKGKK